MVALPQAIIPYGGVLWSAAAGLAGLLLLQLLQPPSYRMVLDKLRGRD